MWAADSQDDQFKALPAQRKVEVNGFLISKYELTETQWYKTMNPSKASEHRKDLPIGNVNWYDCIEFCKLTGLNLPTEAQWEFACRAGTSTKYYSGSTESDLLDVGWFSKNSNDKFHKIGEKPPNSYGLYDMHGNAGEWCLDSFDYANFPEKNTVLKSPMNYHSNYPGGVVRGGTYTKSAMHCRSAYRFVVMKDFNLGSVGFRPVYSGSVCDIVECEDE